MTNMTLSEAAQRIRDDVFIVRLEAVSSRGIHYSSTPRRKLTPREQIILLLDKAHGSVRVETGKKRWHI
jgi:hypothetical protein